MKNYSFSNITNQESFGRRSNDFSNIYRHSELKTSEANLRIEQIKKKYDTPSRRQRIESLKKSRDYEPINRVGKEQSREGIYQHRPAPTFGSNLLKESFAVNRLEKNSLNGYDSKDFSNLCGQREDRQLRRSNEKQNDYGAYKTNNRNEEEMFISKVRQMKESIINNSDYMKSSINPRNSVKMSKYGQFGEVKKDSDPRVQNIDKINMKIKHILSSFSEIQKPSKYSEQNPNSSFLKQQTGSRQSAYFGLKTRQTIVEPKKSYEGHFHKNSDIVQKYNVLDPKQTSEIVKQISNAGSNHNQTFNKYDPPSSKIQTDFQKVKYRDYSVNRVDSYNKDYSISRPQKKEQDLPRTPSYLAKYQVESRALKGSRSRSQIDSFKRSNINQSSDVLKSGKKLNQQISKIQKKIEQFEKQKRKLNISFTPFTLKNKSTANLNVSSKGERQSQDIRQSSKNGQSRQLRNDRSSSTDLKFKSYMNRAANYDLKYNDLTRKNSSSIENNKESNLYDISKVKITQQADFQLKIQQIGINTVRIVENIQTNGEQNINCNFQSNEPQFDEAAIKKRTDEGIEQRRKRWQCQGQIIKSQSLKKLVNLFCEQVKLDENLRNMKIWYQSCFDSDKLNKIIKSLEKDGIKLTPKQCEIIFRVDESQHNPFFSIQGFDGSFQGLAHAYLEADQHWKFKLSHKFQKNSLLNEGFTSQKIDLQRKGFIQLEDLVRFLNIQSGTFYRNRDLYLIFHRFTTSEKLNFQNMLSQISA